MNTTSTPTFRLVAIDGRLHHLWTDGTLLPVIRGGDGDPVPLADLLATVQLVDTDGTQSLAEPGALDDDALATLDADITAAAEAAAAGDVDADVLAQLTLAGQVVQAIRAEAAAREDAATQVAADAAAALAVIRGQEGDEGDPDGDPEADPAADPEADPEADPAADPEADPEAAADPPAADPVPQPVAASAAPRRLAPLAAGGRPSSATPRTVPTPSGDLASLGLVASANAPGVTAGVAITDYDQLAAAFLSAIELTKGYTQGPRVKVKVCTAGRGIDQYPEPMRLDRNTERNMERIEQAQRFVQDHGSVQQAVVASGSDENSRAASGGICGPQQVNYDMPTVGSNARPTRDGFMTRFGADRGGVRTLPMPLLSLIDTAGNDAAVSVWTEATDITPGGSTKPCQVVTCPDEDETIVEAIVRCLEYGNFRARFFPEQIEAWMRLASVAQARFAEERLLAAIATGSTAVTAGQVLGTTRTVLAALDRAISVWRYNHRLPDEFSLAWAAPRWLQDQIRTDIARGLPGDTPRATLAVADAEIAAWFAVRNVMPNWLMDGESGQRFAAQGAGALQGWPSTVKTYLAPAGSWLFLDGGTLDLGVVRDSTLNSTNDVQVFAETFEGAHFHGIESWTLAFDTCPDGKISATATIDPCTTGS